MQLILTDVWNLHKCSELYKSKPSALPKTEFTKSSCTIPSLQQSYPSQDGQPFNTQIST